MWVGVKGWVWVGGHLALLEAIIVLAVLLHGTAAVGLAPRGHLGRRGVGHPLVLLELLLVLHLEEASQVHGVRTLEMQHRLVLGREPGQGTAQTREQQACLDALERCGVWAVVAREVG